MFTKHPNQIKNLHVSNAKVKPSFNRISFKNCVSYLIYNFILLLDFFDAQQKKYFSKYCLCNFNQNIVEVVFECREFKPSISLSTFRYVNI